MARKTDNEKQMEQLRAKIDQLQGEIEELRQNRADLAKRVAKLDKEADSDLAGASPGKLLDVARSQSQAGVEARAARAALGEIERRIQAKQERLEDARRALEIEQSKGAQAAIDAKAIKVVEAANELAAELEELHELEDDFYQRFSLTPHVWFSKPFRERVKGQIEAYEREYEDRKARGLVGD